MQNLDGSIRFCAETIENSIGIDSMVLVRENNIACAPKPLSCQHQLQQSQALFLIGPDNKPDVKPHHNAQPHADADSDIFRHAKSFMAPETWRHEYSH